MKSPKDAALLGCRPLLHNGQGIARRRGGSRGAGNIKVQDKRLVAAIAVCPGENIDRHGGYEIKRVTRNTASRRVGYCGALWRIGKGVAAFPIGGSRKAVVDQHRASAQRCSSCRAQRGQGGRKSVAPSREVGHRGRVEGANRGNRRRLVRGNLGL